MINLPELYSFLTSLDPVVFVLMTGFLGMAILVRWLLKFFMARGLTERELMGELYSMYKDLSKESTDLQSELRRIRAKVAELEFELQVVRIQLENWGISYPPTEEEVNELKTRITKYLRG